MSPDKIPEKPPTGQASKSSDSSKLSTFYDDDPDTYAYSNPDDIYDEGSCSFIYNNSTGRLYLARYPVTHDMMLKKNNYEIAKAVGLHPRRSVLNWHPTREDLMRAGVLSGRVGKLRKTTAIGFWSQDRIERAEIQKVIEEIFKIIPEIKNDRIIVFSDSSFGFTPFALNDKNSHSASSLDDTPNNEPSPKCKKTIKIDGVDFTFQKILSDLHMVRGEKIEKIKSAFCFRYKDLKRELEEDGCNNELNLLNTIKDIVGCHEGREEYERLNSLGKASYHQDLHTVFQKGAQAAFDPNSTEDPIGTEFRGRQKDIDKAWDSLNHRECFTGFRQWLMKETYEEERRKGNNFNTTSSQPSKRRFRTF